MTMLTILLSSDVVSTAFITVVAAIVVVAVLYSIFFSRKAVVKRRLRKAVGKHISTFMNGDIAKVVGKVEPQGEQLTAPLSGRKCSYYYVKVEQHIHAGKSSHWKTIIEEEVPGSFILRDGRYAAYIDCSNIKTYLVSDWKLRSGAFNDASETMEHYLRVHGYESKGVLGFNKTIRYQEGVLEKGELVATVGKGEWKQASQLSLPESLGRILHITAGIEEPVYLSDDPDTIETAYSSNDKYI